MGLVPTSIIICTSDSTFRSTTIAQLQRVQNAAVRLVSNLRSRDKARASLRELHWLPIRYRIIYKLCLMMHNAHVGRSLHYVTEMLAATAHLPNHNWLRSSASTRYELSTLRHKIEEHAFSYSGPASWNSLPSNITSIMDTPTIRVHLKTHLFRLAITFNFCCNATSGRSLLMTCSPSFWCRWRRKSTPALLLLAHYKSI